MQTELEHLELLLDDARYYLRKVEGDSTGLSEVLQHFHHASVGGNSLAYPSMNLHGE